MLTKGVSGVFLPMKLPNLRLTVIAFCCFIFFSSFSENQFELVLKISTDEGSVEKSYKITDDLVIHVFNEDEIHVRNSMYDDTFDKNSIESLTFQNSYLTGINAPHLTDKTGYAVYNMEGVCIFSSKTNQIDFSKLEIGKPYIIIDGNISYKFIKLR